MTKYDVYVYEQRLICFDWLQFVIHMSRVKCSNVIFRAGKASNGVNRPRIKEICPETTNNNNNNRYTQNPLPQISCMPCIRSVTDVEWKDGKNRHMKLNFRVEDCQEYLSISRFLYCESKNSITRNHSSHYSDTATCYIYIRRNIHRKSIDERKYEIVANYISICRHFIHTTTTTATSTAADKMCLVYVFMEYNFIDRACNATNAIRVLVL